MHISNMKNWLDDPNVSSYITTFHLSINYLILLIINGAITQKINYSVVVSFKYDFINIFLLNYRRSRFGILNIILNIYFIDEITT